MSTAEILALLETAEREERDRCASAEKRYAKAKVVAVALRGGKETEASERAMAAHERAADALARVRRQIEIADALEATR